MRKEKSWTRQDYESQCDYIRRGCDVDYLLKEYPDQEQVIKAADYAFQAYGHESTGWINKSRHKRFLQIKWRILTQREVLPY